MSMYMFKGEPNQLWQAGRDGSCLVVKVNEEVDFSLFISLSLF